MSILKTAYLKISNIFKSKETTSTESTENYFFGQPKEPTPEALTSDGEFSEGAWYILNQMKTDLDNFSNTFNRLEKRVNPDPLDLELIERIKFLAGVTDKQLCEPFALRKANAQLLEEETTKEYEILIKDPARMGYIKRQALWDAEGKIKATEDILARTKYIEDIQTQIEEENEAMNLAWLTYIADNIPTGQDPESKDFEMFLVEEKHITKKLLKKITTPAILWDNKITNFSQFKKHLDLIKDTDAALKAAKKITG